MWKKERKAVLENLGLLYLQFSVGWLSLRWATSASVFLLQLTFYIIICRRWNGCSLTRKARFELGLQGRWGQIVTLLSQVHSPNGGARFKTGSADLLWEFQLWRAETSVPRVQPPCSSSPPHQSEQRILQRSSNIPLYIFKALPDHGADRGWAGDGIASHRHSFQFSKDRLFPYECRSGWLCFFSFLFCKNHHQLY